MAASANLVMVLALKTFVRAYVTSSAQKRAFQKTPRSRKLSPDHRSQEVAMNEKPRCGCGRSVTGFCMGWHALSEEDFLKKKEAYELKQQTKSR